jgi:hypothetical protein
MQQRQLKSLIDKGNYRPEPELVAMAMLRHRGMRVLLAGDSVSPAGRIQAASTGGRQAA